MIALRAWGLLRSFLDSLAEDRRPGPLVDIRYSTCCVQYTSVEPFWKLAGANADTGYNPDQVIDVEYVIRSAEK